MSTRLFCDINMSVAQAITANNLPKSMSVNAKKQRFFSLLAPVIAKVYAKLNIEYLSIKNDLQNGVRTPKIDKLKIKYSVKSDEDLLLALKPHPKSITLAQAAIESAWATSRFFNEANNVFGMWSINKNEPRIAAKVKRNASRTIWLKKFNTIEESVRQYYKTISTSKYYKEFREVNYVSNNVYVIVKKLDRYSERGALYTIDLSQIMENNKLTKFDN